MRRKPAEHPDKNITVWKPGITIPPAWYQTASKLQLDWAGGIHVKRRKGCRVLMCGPSCDEHTDMHVNCQWSMLFVIRNDWKSYVVSHGHEPVVEQPVGTLVVLNIWHLHRLAGPDCKGVWAALLWDLPSHPTSDEAIKRVRAALRSRKVKKT